MEEVDIERIRAFREYLERQASCCFASWAQSVYAAQILRHFIDTFPEESKRNGEPHGC